jgi:hypothetical protein
MTNELEDGDCPSETPARTINAPRTTACDLDWNDVRCEPSMKTPPGDVMDALLLQWA